MHVPVGVLSVGVQVSVMLVFRTWVGIQSEGQRYKTEFPVWVPRAVTAGPDSMLFPAATGQRAPWLWSSQWCLLSKHDLPESSKDVREVPHLLFTITRL